MIKRFIFCLIAILMITSNCWAKIYNVKLIFDHSIQWDNPKITLIEYQNNFGLEFKPIFIGSRSYDYDGKLRDITIFTCLPLESKKFPMDFINITGNEIQEKNGERILKQFLTTTGYARTMFYLNSKEQIDYYFERKFNENSIDYIPSNYDCMLSEDYYIYKDDDIGLSLEKRELCFTIEDPTTPNDYKIYNEDNDFDKDHIYNNIEQFGQPKIINCGPVIFLN